MQLAFLQNAYCQLQNGICLARVICVLCISIPLSLYETYACGAPLMCLQLRVLRVCILSICSQFPCGYSFCPVYPDSTLSSNLTQAWRWLVNCCRMPQSRSARRLCWRIANALGIRCKGQSNIYQRSQTLYKCCTYLRECGRNEWRKDGAYILCSNSVVQKQHCAGIVRTRSVGVHHGLPRKTNSNLTSDKPSFQV